MFNKFCFVCCKRCSSEDEYRSHILETHPQYTTEHKCPNCKSVYFRKDLFKKHRKMGCVVFQEKQNREQFPKSLMLIELEKKYRSKIKKEYHIFIVENQS